MLPFFVFTTFLFLCLFYREHSLSTAQVISHNKISQENVHMRDICDGVENTQVVLLKLIYEYERRLVGASVKINELEEDLAHKTNELMNAHKSLELVLDEVA